MKVAPLRETDVTPEILLNSVLGELGQAQQAVVLLLQPNGAAHIYATAMTCDQWSRSSFELQAAALHQIFHQSTLEDDADGCDA